MIIVQLTLGGKVLRITNYGDGAGWGVRGLVAIDDLRYSAPTLHGGRVQWEYGTFTVALEVLQSVHASGGALADWWPPPRSFEDVTVYWQDLSGTITLFPGSFTGWLQEAGVHGATYALWAKSASNLTETDKLYNGTLNQVFTSACATMGLTLNTSKARSPSPAVYWTARGENLIMDNLDTIARYHGHRWWVSAGTLYLVDCLQSYSTDINLRWSQLAEFAYTWPQPTSKYIANYSPPSIGRVLLNFQEDDNDAGQVCIGEVKVSKSPGSTLITPTSVDVYPDNGDGANIDDGNTGTYWFSGSSSVPGAAINIAHSSGIREYAIQARNASPTYAPNRWEQKGWCPDREQYYPMGEVVSSAWTPLEIRRYGIDPGAVNWPIELDNPYSSGDPFADDYTSGEEYTLPATCSRLYANVAAALGVVQWLRERPTIRLTLPIIAVLPGQRVAVANVPMVTGGYISAYLNVDAVSYNTDGTITIEGGGGIEE